MQINPGSSARIALPGPWFHVFVTPILLLAVGIYARRLGRRDGDDSPRRNDLAAGTSVLLMTFGAIAADARSAAGDSVVAVLAWLIILLCATFASVDHDRYQSWERTSDGQPRRTKRWWVGIILPDVASVLLFAFYQALKVRS